MNRRTEIISKNEGKLALSHMWFIVALFSFCQLITSIIVAIANSKEKAGLASASFAAIWSMLLTVIFTVMSGRIVFGDSQQSEMVVGFMIGTAFMLGELFFVLTCVFYILGEDATANEYTTAPSDKAYATFSLLNCTIYCTWGAVLYKYRSVVSLGKSEEAEDEGAETGAGVKSQHKQQQKVSESEEHYPVETFNPTVEGLSVHGGNYFDAVADMSGHGTYSGKRFDDDDDDEPL